MTIYYLYEKNGYESRGYISYEAAEADYNNVIAHIASLFGYCDTDYLFIVED